MLAAMSEPCSPAATFGNPAAIPVCIPARWDASRLPGKLLRPWGDTTVLGHVVRVAAGARLGPVFVLAADDRIAAAAVHLDPAVAVLRPAGTCANGSERVAAALRQGLLGVPMPEIAVNLQGDAVGAEPWLLEAAVEALLSDPGADLATVAIRAPSAEWRGRTTVTVAGGRATAFSRALLPPGDPGPAAAGPEVLLHVGVYAYRTEQLLQVAALPPGPAEEAESLEQLRWLEAGRAVAVRVVQGRAGLAHAIDRPGDLDPDGRGGPAPADQPRDGVAGPPRFGRAIRSEWLLEEGMAFLNHGSFGATPRRVLLAQQRWRTAMERQPLRFFLEEVPPALAAAMADLGSIVGAEPGHIALVDNATTACNAVLRSLDLRAGDEIVAVGHIYPAVAAAIDHVCRRSLARAVAVEIPFPPSGPDEVVERVALALGPATRMVVVDHVSSASALVLPVERIVLLCRDRGIPVLVDGAHAPGMLPLDLDALGADHYAGNCHKWLCSAKGCGFLHSSPSARLGFADLHPPVISLNYPRGFPAEFEWTGTRDLSAWLSLPEALAFHREIGPEAARRHNRDLVLAAGELLARAWGLRNRVPPDMVGSMLTLPSPVQVEPTPQATQALRTRIWHEHRIEVMPVTVEGRTWIRISAQVYNDIDDYRRLAEALA